MATICYKPFGGSRMRVTAVDSLGRPKYGPCSSVVTEGFVSVRVSAEVDEGEDTTVRTASGLICLAETSCPQIRRLNVEMAFCQVDPDLAALINPSFRKLTDYKGDTNGWEESYQMSCDEGIALEVWMNLSAHQNTDRYAQGGWLYYLIPFISSGIVGDEEITAGALNLTLTGRTKQGSNWGVGPYGDVQLNPSPILGGAPVPGPLLTPVASTAMRRRFVTELRPPVALCGCQPLSNPEGPLVNLNEDTTDATRTTVQLVVGSDSAYRVDWGDGTASQDVPSLGLTHKYAARGSYNVSVWSTADPTKITIRRITVPFEGVVTPSVIVREDPADALNRRSVIVTANNHGAGTVVIDWGDTSPTTINAGTGVAQSNHAYAQAGTYIVKVTSQADANSVTSTTVRVPFGSAKPTLTVTEDPANAQRRGVLVAADNHGNGAVSVDWGDGTPTGVNVGDGVTTTAHAYTVDGTYTVKVTDTDDATASATFEVTIPWGPIVTTSQAMSDAKKMTTSLVVNNVGQGAVNVDWGDGTAAGANPGDGVTATTHKYANDGTYTITVTDADVPTRTGTRQVSVPYDGGLAMTLTVIESAPAGPNRRTVTATWDNQDQGPVTITWGDATAADAGASAGTMDHVYAAAGTYTVTVTDANNASRSQTANVTVPFV